MFSAFMKSKSFQDLLRATVLDVLRSPEGQELIAKAYQDRKTWNRMAVINVARSGIFAADRSIREYADNIWHVGHR